MIDPHSIFLLAAALAAVIVLILLIAVFKLNPFISLLLVSLALALAAGMPFTAGIHSFELGMGATLGHIAIIVALGTMLGKMMAESGGADQIAHTLIDFFGEKRVTWAMMAIGLLVGLPCFFEVGFVLLIPIAFTVARRTGKSLILVALPLVAGLSVVHGLVPPHPAAMLAVTHFSGRRGPHDFLRAADRHSHGRARRAALREADCAAHCSFRRRIRWRPSLWIMARNAACRDSGSPCSRSCCRCF